MSEDGFLPFLVLLPAALAGASLGLRTARAVIRFCAAGTLAVAGLAAVAAVRVFRGGPLVAAGDWLMLDGLSAYHAAVMMMVYCLSALYAVGYFRGEIVRGELTLRQARRYGGLWFGSMGAMLLVLVSNNLGILWVGIEATTLLTAFLICVHTTPAALEAMWKYLLMCSVGVAVAFTGTLLIAASAGAAGLHGTETLLWTRLREVAEHLGPAPLKAGFLFLVIGYGTKAGLAPMHSWLPDAHSQAPAPVSAVFSGFLLNAALYGILRCLPLVEAATGNVGWGRDILVLFGLVSILVAAVFIVSQHDLKRLLAYHSVEHLGIIALGIGIGGPAGMAALFHTFNHSLCKTLSFFCAGRLGQAYGTHDMRRMNGVGRVSPIWGGGLISSLLALIGIAPFALFLSEFMILKAALDRGAFLTAAVFLAGLSVVFIGALRHVIPMGWGPPDEPARPPSAGWRAAALVFVPLAVLLLLGLWVPPFLTDLLARGARILGGPA